MSVSARHKTALLIPIQFDSLGVYNAGLIDALQSEPTRRIYLLPRGKPIWSHELRAYKQEALPGATVIISRLRATYGQTNARFSVVSSKRDRKLICAWWSSETIPSPSPSAS